MELLLKNTFTLHYNLPLAIIQDISKQTNSEYFELNDDNLMIYTNVGEGIAKYKNSLKSTVNVINYELFIDSLPNIFTIGREKCDLILYSEDKKYFLLNELTDTLAKYVEPYQNTKGQQTGKREKAKSQLINSLIDLITVDNIKTYINTFSIKRCCFFNKQSNSPLSITATTAFNRINNLTENGFKMPNPVIESFGFEYFEYSENQFLEIS